MQVQTVRGQNVSQRYLRWTQCTRKKIKHVPQAVAVLNFLKLITESSDSEQHHGQNKETTGSQEARGERRETRRNEGIKEEDGRIPQYSSRSCCWSQFLFFRTRSIRTPNISFLLRTHHLLLDRFLSTFTLLLTAALLLLSPSQCP